MPSELQPHRLQGFYRLQICPKPACEPATIQAILRWIATPVSSTIMWLWATKTQSWSVALAAAGTLCEKRKGLTLVRLTLQPTVLDLLLALQSRPLSIGIVCG